jgi:hypothetical protein
MMYAKSLGSAVTQKMGFTTKRDPIPERRARREELTGTVDIDNAGGSLYAQEDQCRINHKYLPQAELERITNQSNGFGDYTNSQLSILQESRFDTMYADDDWGRYYDEETYDYYGTRSNDYIEMVENGEIVHGEFSCDMPEDMGASFEDDEPLAEDHEITPEQQANQDATPPEPKGELATAFDKAADPESLPTPAAVAANNPSYQAPAMSA